MTNFSNKLKKPCSWPIFFPIFWEENLPENPVLSRTTSPGILAPCQISEKTNDTIPRKSLGRRKGGRTDRQKDEQTLFYRTVWATWWGSNKYLSNNIEETMFTDIEFLFF